MAVDTREKRFSMMNFVSPTSVQTLFESDGSIDLDDRQHLLGFYSGVAFDPPAAPPSTTSTFFFQKFILGH